MFTAKQKTKVHQEATVVSFQVFSSVSYVTFIMCLWMNKKKCAEGILKELSSGKIKNGKLVLRVFF